MATTEIRIIPALVAKKDPAAPAAPVAAAPVVAVAPAPEIAAEVPIFAAVLAAWIVFA